MTMVLMKNKDLSLYGLTYLHDTYHHINLI